MTIDDFKVVVDFDLIRRDQTSTYLTVTAVYDRKGVSLLEHPETIKIRNNNYQALMKADDGLAKVKKIIKTRLLQKIRAASNTVEMPVEEAFEIAEEEF